MISDEVLYRLKCMSNIIPKDSSVYNIIRDVTMRTDKAIKDYISNLQWIPTDLHIAVFVNADDFNRISLIPTIKPKNLGKLFDIDVFNIPSYKNAILETNDFIVHYINIGTYKSEITCNIEDVFKC